MNDKDIENLKRAATHGGARPKTVNSRRQARKMHEVDPSRYWSVGDKYFVMCSTNGVRYIKA